MGDPEFNSSEPHDSPDNGAAPINNGKNPPKITVEKKQPNPFAEMKQDKDGYYKLPTPRVRGGDSIADGPQEAPSLTSGERFIAREMSKQSMYDEPEKESLFGGSLSSKQRKEAERMSINSEYDEGKNAKDKRWFAGLKSREDKEYDKMMDDELEGDLDPKNPKGYTYKTRVDPLTGEAESVEIEQPKAELKTETPAGAGWSDADRAKAANSYQKWRDSTVQNAKAGKKDDPEFLAMLEKQKWYMLLAAAKGKASPEEIAEIEASLALAEANLEAAKRGRPLSQEEQDRINARTKSRTDIAQKSADLKAQQLAQKTSSQQELLRSKRMNDMLKQAGKSTSSMQPSGSNLIGTVGGTSSFGSDQEIAGQMLRTTPRLAQTPGLTLGSVPQQQVNLGTPFRQQPQYAIVRTPQGNAIVQLPPQIPGLSRQAFGSNQGQGIPQFGRDKIDMKTRGMMGNRTITNLGMQQTTTRPTSGRPQGMPAMNMNDKLRSMMSQRVNIPLQTRTGPFMQSKQPPMIGRNTNQNAGLRITNGITGMMGKKSIPNRMAQNKELKIAMIISATKNPVRTGVVGKMNAHGFSVQQLIPRTSRERMNKMPVIKRVLDKASLRKK